jgi:hypothetical protein
MAIFDYNAGAGLYPCKTHRMRSRIQYQRFESAAEALRFAMEDMPAPLLRGSILETDDARFDAEAIRRLYEASDYPLPRRLAPAKAR